MNVCALMRYEFDEFEPISDSTLKLMAERSVARAESAGIRRERDIAEFVLLECCILASTCSMEPPHWFEKIVRDERFSGDAKLSRLRCQARLEFGHHVQTTQD
jgi:hypothetical protein